MTIKKLTVFILIFFSTNLFSQIKISGQINSEKNNPIEFIEIQLQNKDSIIFKSEITNTEGKFIFEIEKGEYALLVRQMGVIYHKQKININQNTDLGIIKITESQQEIKEVVIISKKKLLERRSDRLIFNIENSISAIGGDAIDALSITPGLKVQGDNIAIIGKAGVDVMINNKKTQLSGNDLISYLKTIRSENISKIEVITNPSAKYDSEGNSGLINIILKKNLNKGINGSLQSTLNKGHFWNFNNGLNLNYQDDKIKISWKGNLANVKSKSLEYNKIESLTQSIENNTNRDLYGVNMSSYFNIDYTLTEKSSFGFVYNISKRVIDGDGKTNTIIQNSTFQNVNSTTNSDSDGLINSLNGYYNYNINKEGKKISIEGNYITNNVDNNTNNNSSFTYTNFKNTKNNSFKIKTAQIDFELPNKWCKIETGAKLTSTDANNEINSIENSIVSANNLFSLNEKITALYLTSSKEISKKWTIDLGLRYEYTHLNFKPQSNEEITSNYDNIFPTVSVLFNQNENSSWSMNYNKRLSRPKFEDLNPYKYYNNSFSYSTGNPYLKPSISHNVELNYTYKKTNMSLYGSRLLDGSGGLTSIQNDFQIIKTENYYNENSFGFNINYTHMFFKIWESTFYGDGHFENSTSTILQKSTFNGWNGYFSSNNSVILNKSKSFVFFANYWQTTKTKTDFRTIQPNSNLSLGFRYSLLSKKLQLSFTVRDALKQEYKKGISVLENGTNTYNNYYDARRFIFSLNYKFGSKKVKASQKSINNDEQNRTIKE